MVTTFAGGLNPSFYGAQIRSGVPAYDNNGNVRTVGGFISASNTNPALFGTALYAAPAKPNEFYVGPTAAATVFRGILLNRFAVNEQSPAHADRLLNTQPADAIYEGAVWVTVDSYATAIVGGTVTADTDGTLKVAAAGATGALATIVDKDDRTERVLIRL